MKQALRASLMMIVLFTILTGVLYPLAVTLLSQTIFPSQANGSMIERNGKPIGSALIGQQFTSPKYFWSRLSVTGPFPYNAGASSGSNYGPLNPALKAAVQNRINQLHRADSTNTQPIPVDLVTASASGLDPHISVASALYQVSRVAHERKLSNDNLVALVNKCIEHRTLTMLGEPRVNVLKLNLALDDMTSSSEGSH